MYLRLFWLCNSSRHIKVIEGIFAKKRNVKLVNYNELP